MKKNNLYYYENKYTKLKYKFIGGIDEVGRGALAGPIVVAACILPTGYKNDEINDSKILTSKKREKLFNVIVKNAISYSIVFVDSTVVDKKNPKNSTISAMNYAIMQLKKTPSFILVDGEKINTKIPFISIIKGDSKSITIAAASILAKVARDRYMANCANIYYDYKFDLHKGYGTKLHLTEIKKNMPIKSFHRFSYEPIKNTAINNIEKYN